MNKFITLTPQDMVDWGVANLPMKQLRCIGTDGSGIFVFDTIPSRFSSKTVYNESEFDAMLRDNTSVFYTQGY
tara:strand:+ start:1104 stop:1322 length:219 start_codon:yes stop_codon:yes gene_type:complete